MFGKNLNSKDSDERSRENDPGSRGPESDRVLALLAQDYLREKVSRRRWGIFFKFVFLAYIVGITVAYFGAMDSSGQGEHTAVVEISGIIGPEQISANKINQSLSDAFSSNSSVGVVLKINSPGGTPVQAAQINEEINRLKEIYPSKPVYAAVLDICASGGYYVAVAADEIFAHPSSIVGSIGVLMNGFGFVGAMEKLGIERRLITAGENKGILDPFSPIDLEQKKHAEKILGDVHTQFIAAVKLGRGDRLTDDEKVFSGLFWSGEEARQLGLIDQFGTVEQIARDVLGAELLVDYTYRPDFIERVADRIGTALFNSFFERTASLL